MLFLNLLRSLLTAPADNVLHELLSAVFFSINYIFKKVQVANMAMKFSEI